MRELELRNHRTTPKSNYTPLRNALIQDTRLTLGAHGLLDYLLSQKDGTPTDIKKLAAQFPDGQKAISGYFHELVRWGYVVRRKVRQWVQETGRWVVRTVVEVFDIPQEVGSEKDLSVVSSQVAVSLNSPSLDGPSLEDPSPSPSGKKTGKKTPSPDPLPMPVPEPDGREELISDEELAAGAALLTKITRDEERLVMGVAEMLPALPLVAEWLSRGGTPSSLRQALTQGLPEHVYAPGAFVLNRLKRKMPPPIVTVAEVTAARPAMRECDECGRPTSGRCTHGADEAAGMAAGALERKAKHVSEARAMLAARLGKQLSPSR
ncbi:hypothetical protein GCM10010149_88030 [Nonomuraea roseoviolacea subsp. roseoviolacea]|uniref:hypothetical protein n=1 Tax=Nonomuraea roseoviolacea TaxID=103837 RepID=UPI0031D1AF8A